MADSPDRAEIDRVQRLLDTVMKQLRDAQRDGRFEDWHAGLGDLRHLLDEVDDMGTDDG